MKRATKIIAVFIVLAVYLYVKFTALDLRLQTYVSKRIKINIDKVTRKSTETKSPTPEEIEAVFQKLLKDVQNVKDEKTQKNLRAGILNSLFKLKPEKYFHDYNSEVLSKESKQSELGLLNDALSYATGLKIKKSILEQMETHLDSSENARLDYYTIIGKAYVGIDKTKTDEYFSKAVRTAGKVRNRIEEKKEILRFEFYEIFRPLNEIVEYYAEINPSKSKEVLSLVLDFKDAYWRVSDDMGNERLHVLEIAKVAAKVDVEMAERLIRELKMDFSKGEIKAILAANSARQGNIENAMQLLMEMDNNNRWRAQDEIIKLLAEKNPRQGCDFLNAQYSSKEATDGDFYDFAYELGKNGKENEFLTLLDEKCFKLSPYAQTHEIDTMRAYFVSGLLEFDFIKGLNFMKEHLQPFGKPFWNGGLSVRYLTKLVKKIKQNQNVFEAMILQVADIDIKKSVALLNTVENVIPEDAHNTWHNAWIEYHEINIVSQLADRLALENKKLAVKVFLSTLSKIKTYASKSKSIWGKENKGYYFVLKLLELAPEKADVVAESIPLDTYLGKDIVSGIVKYLSKKDSKKAEQYIMEVRDVYKPYSLEEIPKCLYYVAVNKSLVNIKEAIRYAWKFEDPHWKFFALRDIALKAVPEDIATAKNIMRKAIEFRDKHENYYIKLQRNNPGLCIRRAPLPGLFTAVLPEDWKNAFTLIDAFDEWDAETKIKYKLAVLNSFTDKRMASMYER